VLDRDEVGPEEDDGQEQRGLDPGEGTALFGDYSVLPREQPQRLQDDDGIYPVVQGAGGDASVGEREEALIQDPMSPTLTISFASSLSFAPMSIQKSFIWETFFRSSASMRWMAFSPIMPGTSAAPCRSLLLAPGSANPRG
jgi:hypothetical protein